MMTRNKATTSSKSKAAGAAATSGAEDSAEECETPPTQHTQSGQPGLPAQPAQPTLGDLQNSITDFKTFLTAKLDKISSDVAAINTKFNELETSVEFNSAKLSDLEKKTLPKLEATLQKKNEYLENKILSLEIHSRKANLLFYGIQQQDGENIYDVLKEAFISLGIDAAVAGGLAVANAHRLPRRESGAEAPRQAPVPIIARFCYMRERESVLAAFEEQQRRRAKAPAEPGHTQRRLTVRTDLPPAMKARRGVLADAAFKMRKEKGLATRIFVKGTEVHLQYKEKGTSRWSEFTD